MRGSLEMGVVLLYESSAICVPLHVFPDQLCTGNCLAGTLACGITYKVRLGSGRWLCSYDPNT